MIIIKCKECGCSFTSANDTKEYCSKTCEANSSNGRLASNVRSSEYKARKRSKVSKELASNNSYDFIGIDGEAVRTN